MQFSTITASLVAVLAGIASAAPAHQARDFQASITFEGAADASFSLEVPTDGSSFQINNPLSISHIYSDGGATCTFYGIDGSVTTVVGQQTIDVGPPQTQVSGSCLAF